MNSLEDQKATAHLASMKNLPLHQFFLDGLQDMNWAENRIVQVMPEIIKAITAENLKDAIRQHLDETYEHVSRLEKAFLLLEEKTRAVKCKAIAGILGESDDIISETKKGSAVRDAALIMALQKIEHYEIASYGSLLTFSKLMEHEAVSQLLAATLMEEKTTDDVLSSLANEYINPLALEETT